METNMLKKILIIGVAVIGLVVCGFMAGNLAAGQGVITPRSLGQQPLPTETIAAYGFPRTWGGLHSVEATGSGFTYFFVASDGTIRAADANAGSIVAILVIPPR
jgi:hypothetical protein